MENINHYDGEECPLISNKDIAESLFSEGYGSLFFLDEKTNKISLCENIEEVNDFLIQINNK